MFTPMPTIISNVRRTVLTLTAATTLALAASANSIAPAMASDLVVKYDQSQLLRLPRDISEIIIGNPTIADVTVQSSNMLIVTGKSFGITNIIILDAERNVIADQRVLVQRDEVKVVNLQKGAERQSYNCSPQCNPSITVGDDAKYFNKVAADSAKKIGISSGQAKSSSERNQ